MGDLVICTVSKPCFDIRVRLYSAKTFKKLGTLAYHKEGCYTVAFAHGISNSRSTEEDNEDEVNSTWLATGGKDGRIAIWQLMDFTKP
jgi:ASTRA-associated protein 1